MQSGRPKIQNNHRGISKNVNTDSCFAAAPNAGQINKKKVYLEGSRHGASDVFFLHVNLTDTVDLEIVGVANLPPTHFNPIPGGGPFRPPPQVLLCHCQTPQD